MKKSFRFYVYILSINREKQLCNKATKSHFESVCVQETLQQQNENSFISDFN